MQEDRDFLTMIVRGMFAVAAVLWLVVGLLAASGAISIGPVDTSVRWALVVLMTAAAGVLAFLAWRVLTGSRWVDAFAVLVAFGNVLVTVIDDVGTYDLAYLAFSIVLLGALLGALMQRRRARAR